MTNRAASHLLPVFARVDLGFERGEGCWLTATNGERYLDFTSGVAVNALGHCHPHLIAALQEQATKLWHMSNLFKSQMARSSPRGSASRVLPTRCSSAIPAPRRWKA